MTRIARRLSAAIFVATSIVAFFSLRTVYRSPVTVDQLFDPQFAFGYLSGGIRLVFVFLLGDRIDSGADDNQE